MEKKEILDLFKRITANSADPKFKIITEDGFLLAADIIAAKSFKEGMISGFEEIESVLNLPLLTDERTV